MCLINLPSVFLFVDTVDCPIECPVVSFCVNTDGSYSCQCYHGYREVTPFPNLVCADINECDDIASVHECHSNAICVNNPGGYQCICPRQEDQDIVPGEFCPGKLET